MSRPPPPRAEREPAEREPAEEPPATWFSAMRPNGAVILLGLVFALAMVETIAAFLAYRERITDDDWREVTDLLDEHRLEGEPLFVASEWLSPRARMELPDVGRPEWLGAPDLRGLGHYWLLTEAHERPFAGPIRAELEDLERPELLAVHRAGGLSLHEFVAADAAKITFSLLETTPELSTSMGKCSGGGAAWRCKDARIARRLLEVAHRPRYCLAIDVDDGTALTLDLGEVELGDHLRGHVGFADFNARLRSDATATIEAVIDEHVAGRWLFNDDQGWAGFALSTEPGVHHLALRVSSTVAGTWQSDGHRTGPNDTICFEARGLLEEST